MTKPPIIEYEQGSLVLSGYDPIHHHIKAVQFDQRTLQYRAAACSYRDILVQFSQHQVDFIDNARSYKKLTLDLSKTIVPRSHQKEALKAWSDNQQQGVVSLPTGSGKTILALLAIIQIKRSTLVVVPTIDLLNQWHDVLSDYLNCPIGRLGGGHKDYQAIMITTYDSCRMMIESHGHHFAFLVVDECHHLPAQQNTIIANASIAPFRLGLSATVERADGAEKELYNLLGPKVYEGLITDLVTKSLAPYDVISIEVSLSEDEKKRYEHYRGQYLNFIRQKRLNFSQGNGWQQFIIQSSRSPQGKQALAAFYEQKKIAQNAQGKLLKLWDILNQHPLDPMIIFTDNNALAYQIGRDFCLAVITHKTKLKERKFFLDQFRAKKLHVLVTSKVLNEGVDVPSATVGVVVSGSGTVREHVQRLGRLLRHAPGKRAVLYELVAKSTSETYVNERRKQHHAYQKPASV